MAAEIAIVGLVTGSFGFVFAVRNAISKLVDDIDTVQNDFDALCRSGLRLSEMAQIMLEWRDKWHIHEGSPGGLPTAYWGEHGCNEIRVRLRLIEKTTRGLEHKFNREFHGDCVATNYIPVGLTSELMKTEKEAEIRLNEARSRFKQRNIASRTYQALAEHPIFEKHLSELSYSINELVTSSNYMFKRQRNRGSQGWEDDIGYISHYVHLLELASINVQDSASMHGLMSEANNLCIELYLDHRISNAADRAELIRDASRCRALRHQFCLSCPQINGAESVDFSCLPIDESCDLDSQGGKLQTCFSSTAQQLLTRKGSYETKAYSCGQQRPFFIRKEAQAHESVDEQKEPLRSFLKRTHEPLGNILKSRFALRERHMLAYELSEWMLLCLQTLWFSNLCSCCIARVETPDLSVVYRAMVSPLRKHVATDTGKPVLTKEWCQEELSSMHVRRLGVILTEIGCGSPAPDVAFHPQKGIEIDESHDSETSVRGRRQINEAVERTMGLEYMKAADFCRQFSKLAHEIDTDEIRNFLRNVVHPLYELYVESVLKPQRRRRHRATGA